MGKIITKFLLIRSANPGAGGQSPHLLPETEQVAIPR